MNFKDKKGSISIFVLVMLLFMSAFLLISYAINVGKSKTIKEQFNIISGIYSYTDEEEGAYNKAYTDLRKKNKQVMTASSETSSIELTKTYADKLSNLKIYGNSIQDGTPTSSNPVEVQSVGNKVNLFNNALPYRDLDTLITSKEELLEGISQGQMIFYGIYSSSIGSEIVYKRDNTTCVIVPIENNKTYVMNNYKKANLILLDENFIELEQSTANTITNSVNAKYLFAYVSNSVQASDGRQTWKIEDILNGLQIEEGLETTEYVPYGKYLIKVKINGKGKNLVNVPNGTLKMIDNIDSIDQYSEARTKDIIDLGDISNLAGKTLTLSVGKWKAYYSDGTETKARVRITTYDKDGNRISMKYVINPAPTTFPASGTVTLEENAYYAIISTATGSTLNVEIEDFMIEEGNVATEYEEYKEEIVNIYLDEPLRKLGTYMDYLDLKTGTVVRNIGYSILSGSNMRWSAYDDNQENVLGFYTGSLPSIEGTTRKSSLSNRFVRSDTDIAPKAILGVNNEAYYIVDSYFKVAVSKERATDLATFKTWLDNNPTYVYYILPSTTEENISLPELSTYEDYTKIEVLTDVEPSKIETEYTGYTLD